jgi:hypothetical protein
VAPPAGTFANIFSRHRPIVLAHTCGHCDATRLMQLCLQHTGGSHLRSVQPRACASCPATWLQPAAVATAPVLPQMGALMPLKLLHSSKSTATLHALHCAHVKGHIRRALRLADPTLIQLWTLYGARGTPWLLLRCVARLRCLCCVCMCPISPVYCATHGGRVPPPKGNQHGLHAAM